MSDLDPGPPLVDQEQLRQDELEYLLSECNRLMARVIDLGGDVAAHAEKLLALQEAIKDKMVLF